MLNAAMVHKRRGQVLGAHLDADGVGQRQRGRRGRLGGGRVAVRHMDAQHVGACHHYARPATHKQSILDRIVHYQFLLETDSLFSLHHTLAVIDNGYCAKSKEDSFKNPWIFDEVKRSLQNGCYV